MSLYELTLVLKEGEDPKDLALGKIKTKKSWGVKDFAYPIKKALRGGYFYFEVELGPEEAAALGKSFKQNDQILRYLLIRAKE